MFFSFLHYINDAHRCLHFFPTRRSSDLGFPRRLSRAAACAMMTSAVASATSSAVAQTSVPLTNVSTISPEGALRLRSEEHTSELQSRLHLVCRLLVEKKKYADDSWFSEL